MSAEKLKEIISKLETNSIKAYLFKPAPQAVLWNECYRDKNIRIGWDEVFREIDKNYLSYKDNFESQIKELMQTYGGGEDPASVLLFVNIQVGDVILAFKGKSKLMGIGLVEKSENLDKNWTFDETKYTDYKTFYHVNWLVDLQNEDIPLDPKLNAPIATLRRSGNTKAILIIGEVLKVKYNEKIALPELDDSEEIILSEML